MITATLIGDREFIARMTAVQGRLPQGVARTVLRLAIQLDRLVKQKLSGQVLNVRTGVLRSSAHYRINQSTTEVTATEGTNVKYARIHEYGGTIHVPEIRPKTARALAFEVGGQTIFRMSAAAHDVRMPERSFLRSALREMKPQIKAELEATVSQELHR